MSLYEKIVAKHPELKPEDFHPATGTILLQDDSDSFGPYIARWEHPTLPQPSDEELGITRNAANVIIEGEIIPDVAVLEGPTADEPVGGA
jgi:hypothetical protein